MTIDNFTLISGSDVILAGVPAIKQPTLNDIRHASGGYREYSAFTRLFSLDLCDLVGDEQAEEFKERDIGTFILMIADEKLRELLYQALSFFTRDDIVFDAQSASFRDDKGNAISKENFGSVCDVILDVSCIKHTEKTKLKFANEKARKIWEKIEKGRQSQKKNDSGDETYSVPNIISALSAKHPSINLVNVWDLTVWQLYDQFARTNVNNQVDIIGSRWAAWGKDKFDFDLWYKKNKQ